MAQPVQTKLVINEPGDRSEQEADKMANRVMQAPESRGTVPMVASAISNVQRKCACGGTCSKCQGERNDDQLHRKAAGSGELGQTIAPPIVHEALQSPGNPLDATTRVFMESRFGHDFSRVRVHADQLSARSAEAIGAYAYTVGSNVVFGSGYAPTSEEGQRLLAHELTHVLQQSARDLSPSPAFNAGDGTTRGLVQRSPSSNELKQTERAKSLMAADARLQYSSAAGLPVVLAHMTDQQLHQMQRGT